MQDFVTCHWVGAPQRGSEGGVYQKLMNRLWLMSGDIIKMYLYIFKLRLLTEWGVGQRQKGMGEGHTMNDATRSFACWWKDTPTECHSASAQRQQQTKLNSTWKPARKAWRGGNERMSKRGWECEWKWKFLIISSKMPQKVLWAGRAIYNIWKSAHSHG